MLSQKTFLFQIFELLIGDRKLSDAKLTELKLPASVFARATKQSRHCQSAGDGLQNV